MSNKKPMPVGTVESSTVYRATTGLENARGERVEQGEILPSDFVPSEQLLIWLQNRDVIAVFDAAEEESA